VVNEPEKLPTKKARCSVKKVKQADSTLSLNRKWYHRRLHKRWVSQKKHEEYYNRLGCSSPVGISRALGDQIEEAAVVEQVPERIDGEYGDAGLLGEGRKEEGEDGESEEAQVRAAGSGGSVIGEERQ
jgi:hypothetical protein